MENLQKSINAKKKNKKTSFQQCLVSRSHSQILLHDDVNLFSGIAALKSDYSTRKNQKNFKTETVAFRWLLKVFLLWMHGFRAMINLTHAKRLVSQLWFKKEF